MPIITHLDQLGRTGLFDVFPETLGEGDPSTWPYGGTTVKPACFSKLETARVLAGWMLSLAEKPNVDEICVWLSEHHVACECTDCAKKGQFVLESEAIARGYKIAQMSSPDIKVRVLLTQGSYADNAKVFATLPGDVGVSYYDGGRTYDSSRNPMIYPLIEASARSRWLGCYPQLTASWRIVCPWSAPQFIKFRMTEFVDKELECLCGYATPDNRFYDFNVAAAAEWSWNAHGRDEREFALAYFTQKGVADPVAAADWAVTLGPVGWDIYGARVPYNWFFGSIARALRDGNLPPLGEGPFVYLKSEERIDEDLAACATAMELARRADDAALIHETRVIEGYLRMLSAIHGLGGVTSGAEALAEDGKQKASRLLAELDAACSQTTQGLQDWKAAVAPDSQAGRFFDTVQVTEETTAAIGDFLSSLGVDDPGRPYRKKTIGSWATDDFAGGPETTKQWDVTDHLSGPGTYRVRFVYKSGWYGLGIHKAELLLSPKDAPGDPTPVAEDEHEGTAAHQNFENEYELVLTEHDPDARYVLSADIRGCPESSPADKQGCEGNVVMWKVRPE